jgi:membrane protease YdiL (CAAX protease family)
MSDSAHILGMAETGGATGMRRIFWGPNGLRAGWRLLIFLAILLPTGYVAGALIDSAMLRLHVDFASPLGGTFTMAIYAAALFLVTSVMGRIEGRSFADYGLPWRRAFCRQFWQGAAISFVSLTALLMVLFLFGAFSFGSLALYGADIWKYGLLWTIPLFLSALVEDFLYRGYLLFTLTTGIGFWPAAVFTSLLMGGMHYFNPGGHGLGPAAATMYCLVTCLILRRTGDLWMPLGVHAAWGWGEIYFFGVVSSGYPGLGHLFNSTFHGPVTLTGGTFGPEGSWPNIVLLVIWGIGFSVWLRGVKYPNPAAVARSRR